ncbi:hypothetical protein QYF36_021422 [Acer negundo]|nr:hypothetical protein QYF36_021422 [Acer negundo]
MNLLADLGWKIWCSLFSRKGIRRPDEMDGESSKKRKRKSGSEAALAKSSRRSNQRPSLQMYLMDLEKLVKAMVEECAKDFNDLRNELKLTPYTRRNKKRDDPAHPKGKGQIVESEKDED